MSNKYRVTKCLECKDCEHIQFKGKYKECPECLGIGSHWINKKTDIKTLVWCLSK